MEDWTQSVDNDAGDPDYVDDMGEMGRSGALAGINDEDEVEEPGIMGYFNEKVRTS